LRTSLASFSCSSFTAFALRLPAFAVVFGSAFSSLTGTASAITSASFTSFFPSLVSLILRFSWLLP
jgi:hypothetical protein